MKKRLIFVFCCMLLSLSACAKAPEQPKDGLTVYAAFHAFAYFTGLVSGSLPDTIVPSGADPHDWEPSAREMAYLEDASVIVYGAGVGRFMEDLRGIAANAAFIDATDGLPADENPHVWLNPAYAKQMAATIAEGFCRVDPENDALYRQNLADSAEKFDDLAAEYARRLAPFEGRAIVVDHAAYGHLCAAYGLEQVALSGLEDDAEPTPTQMAKVIDFIKSNDIGTLFVAPGEPAKAAEAVAGETGVSLAVLDPFEIWTFTDGFDPEIRDYFTVMAGNLGAIEESFGAGR